MQELGLYDIHCHIVPGVDDGRKPQKIISPDSTREICGSAIFHKANSILHSHG